MLAKESADSYGKKVIFCKKTNKKCPKHTAAVRAHSDIYTGVANLTFCQLPGSDRSHFLLYQCELGYLKNR